MEVVKIANFVAANKNNFVKNDISVSLIDQTDFPENYTINAPCQFEPSV